MSACSDCGVVDERGYHTQSNCKAVIRYQQAQTQKKLDAIMSKIAQDEKLLALFLNIESIQFSVELGVCSGLTSFLRAMEVHSHFLPLQEVARTQPEKIVERLAYVAVLSFDHAFENPYDTAAAAYFWALHTQTGNMLQGYEMKAIMLLNVMNNIPRAKQVLAQAAVEASQQWLTNKGALIAPAVEQAVVIEKPKPSVLVQVSGWKYWATVYAHYLVYMVRSWWHDLWA